MTAVAEFSPARRWQRSAFCSSHLRSLQAGRRAAGRNLVDDILGDYGTHGELRYSTEPSTSTATADRNASSTSSAHWDPHRRLQSARLHA
ncbi:MAG: hypothetical protein R2862_01065 [Thermoanaerobaculia bacterium]